MALTPNLAQINSASKGNNDLRETLTSLLLATQQQQAQTGTGPLKKVDTTPTAFTGPPSPCGLTVTGANGQFSVSISLPQQAGGSSAPQNSTGVPLYQELSSSTVANFASGVTTYPLSTNTSYVFPNPGASLYWRLRSSYDQKTFNSYQVQPGIVNAGLQTSSATEPNISLNQSNFATVDSIAAGSTATVRIYGSGGVGTSWTRISGDSSQVYPAGTILNVAYGSNLYVAWDGMQYQVVPSLTQTFLDGWVPVGNVSVIANGSGLVLPTFKAIVSSGAIVAIQILTAGNGMTTNPTITITDSSGTGATAICTESGGAATGVTVTNAGSGYSSSPTVTASGGVANGTGGGGGPQGTNAGRLYGTTTNGA
jgi:hypothetical protein